ncbi:MAG: hypothetical protein NW208_04875 [Bryobacter sp.]|nr:hypothetical protein [Bryobacter sp.]
MLRLRIFALSWLALTLSCQNGQLRTWRTQVYDLDGLAEVSLPTSFVRLNTLGRNRNLGATQGNTPGPQVRLLGDHSLDPEETNFWAVSHAFLFDPERPGARLLVSSLADAQSFSPPSVYFRWATRVFGYTSPDDLAWTSTELAPGTRLFETSWPTGAQSKQSAWVLMDKDKLLQATLFADTERVPQSTALEVFRSLRESYRLRSALGPYFTQVRSTLNAMADRRRAQYLNLLETLEEEELDYAPTSQVVLFNRNLACQFWSRTFDNSGVPWEFAIAARLGKIKTNAPALWQKLEPPGLSPFSLLPGANGWVRQALVNTSPMTSLRLQTLVEGAKWARQGTPPEAYVGMHFSFAQPIPDLSEWLTNVDQLSRAAEMADLIEAAAR